MMTSRDITEHYKERTITASNNDAHAAIEHQQHETFYHEELSTI